MEDTVAPLFDVNFIQDAKFLTVKHPQGISLYTTNDVLENTPNSQKKAFGSLINLNDTLIVERLANTHFAVIVHKKEPRTMHVLQLSTNITICKNMFSRSILSIKLNRERIIICLEDSILIYGIRDMELKHSILETPTNELGLIDLVAAEKGSLIAYPGSAITGIVNIFDATQLTAVKNFMAHEGPLAALKFNSSGTMLATASDKGTVIRVFCTTEGQKLFEFRRGVSRYVTIYSLAFSEDSKYLCSSSNTETVHVFKLEKSEEPEAASEATGWYSYLTQVASTYLPTQVNDLVTTERSFAIARLPGNEMKSVAAIPTIKSKTRLLVATADGFIYSYCIDEKGGECDLMKQKKIGSDVENTTNENRPPSDFDNEEASDTKDVSEFPPIHCSA